MISNVFNILGKLLEHFRSLYYRVRDGEINIQKNRKTLDNHIPLPRDIGI